MLRTDWKLKAEIRDKMLARWCSCYSDSNGNRPCDNGVWCDKCRTEDFEELCYSKYMEEINRKEERELKEPLKETSEKLELMNEKDLVKTTYKAELRMTECEYWGVSQQNIEKSLDQLLLLELSHNKKITYKTERSYSVNKLEYIVSAEINIVEEKREK